MTGIFRDNVAALIMRADGRILLGECADKPGTWSFPQGGVDEGETRREALIRELYEEVALRARDFEILGSRAGYSYSYPPGRLKKGIYCGQMQTYFLCKLKKKQPNSRGGSAGAPEFLRLRWVAPWEFDMLLIPVFKREVTRQVISDFFKVDVMMPDPATFTTLDAIDTDPEVML